MAHPAPRPPFESPPPETPPTNPPPYSDRLREDEDWADTDVPDDSPDDERATVFFDRWMEKSQRRFAPAPERPEAPPTQVGPWKLLGEIGRGGTGVVYRGQHTDRPEGEPVAVKVGSALGGLADRFAQEHGVLTRFGHPAVVRGHEVGRDDAGRPYLVMEYVEGTRVTAHARDLPLPDRLRTFRDVCRAVAVVHELRVAHCDLKPGNVYVTPAGAVKLLDFGSARQLDAPMPETDLPFVTPEFAAPEQILGAPLSEATDVYALGLLLHEILYGRRHRLPWSLSGGRGTVFFPALDGLTDAEIARLTPTPLSEPDPAFTGTKPVLDWGIDAILGTALQNEPAHRYPTAAELTADVNRVLHALPTA